MVTFQCLIGIGENLRKSPNRYLTLKQLTDILAEYSGSFHNNTIKNYLQVLVKHGYIKSVVINGAPMWEVLQKDEK